MVKLAMKSCKTRNDARATAVIAPANLKRTYVPIGKKIILKFFSLMMSQHPHSCSSSNDAGNS